MNFFDLATNYIFYVGMGTCDRWKDIRPKFRNRLFNEYIDTHECGSRKIKGNLTQDEAYALEYEIIEEYKKLGYCSCNIAEGGRKETAYLGEKNPNYKNDTLHNRYMENKEFALEKQSRPRSQNGMAKTVYVYIDKTKEFVGEFGCVPDAMDYLVNECGLKHRCSTNKNLYGMVYTNMCHDKPYRGYYFTNEKLN